MNPLKRNLSRSPDGSSNQRKISRGLPTDTDRQKNPSINTNQVNATADPRLLRGSRGNALVQSPISTDGSAYQDAASNRTTPQPQTAVMTTAGQTNDEGDAFKKQLLESLVALTTHITADASIRSSHDLARRRLDSATAEHQSMKDHFRKYPAIEERLSDDRDKAAKKVAKLEKQLEASGGSQSKAVAPLCETIWDLFSKAAASSRSEPQRDSVTREEHEELQTRFQKQQHLIDEQHDRIEELRKIAKEANETSVQTRNQSKTVSEKITSLEARVVKAESSQSEQADKRTLSDLAGTVSKQGDGIGQLRSGISQNKLNLAAVEEDTATRLKNAASSASADLGKVERQLIAIRNDVDQIWKDIQETGKQPVVARLKIHDQHLNNLLTKANSAEDRLGRLSQDLNKRQEDSKEPARIKLAEEKIDNLALKLSEMKEDARLKASSSAATIVPAPATNPVPTAPPANFNLAAFKQEVVDDVEEQTEKIAEMMDEHDQKIEKLKEGLDSLSDKHNKLELEHDNEIRKRQSLDQANSEARDTTKARCDSIHSDATTLRSTMETLRSDIDSLSTMVTSLQDRLSQPSTATNGTAAAQQFRPISVHSPQAPTPRTSISGPVQTNGIHPPNGIIPPQQMANGSSLGPSNGEVAVTPDQIQGIWAAVHSLQHRYDNLTTEEVVRAMVDQQSKMYPAPKEFQAAVNMLQNVDHAIDAKLTSLETKFGALETKIGSLATNSTILRSEFKNYATENNTHMNARIQQLQNDVNTVRDGVKQLRTDTTNTINSAKTSFDHAVDLQTDVINDMRSKVDGLANVAFDD